MLTLKQFKANFASNLSIILMIASLWFRFVAGYMFFKTVNDQQRAWMDNILRIQISFSNHQKPIRVLWLFMKIENVFSMFA